MNIAENQVRLWYEGKALEAAKRVFEAMMPMQKIDIATLEAARRRR